MSKPVADETIDWFEKFGGAFIFTSVITLDLLTKNVVIPFIFPMVHNFIQKRPT